MSPFESWKKFPLLELPDVAIDQILGNLSFKDVSILRTINKEFNKKCMRHLNNGFRNAEIYHLKCHQVSRSSLFVAIVMTAFVTMFVF